MNAIVHTITHKGFRYQVNKFIINTYMVVSSFLRKSLILKTLKHLNLPPYVCHNLILIYHTKVIKMIGLLKIIFTVYFYSFFLYFFSLSL